MCADRLTEHFFLDLIPKDERGKVFYVPTVRAFLEYLLELYPHRPAIVSCGVTYNYEELYDHVGRRRNFLYSIGLQPGAHVGILDENTADAAELLLAVMSAGYVAVMLPVKVVPAYLPIAVDKLHIAVLFAGQGYVRECRAVQTGISLFPVSSTGIDFSPADISVGKDTPAAIFPSSTVPTLLNCALLSQGNIMRGAFNSTFRIESRAYPQRYIAMVPFSDALGSIFGLLGCLYSGAQIYLDNEQRPIDLIPVIKPHVMVVNVAILKSLIVKIHIWGLNFLGGELNVVCCMASPNIFPLINELTELGVWVHLGYGRTETSILVAVNPNYARHPDSLGKVLPMQESKIVDNELWIRGDNVFLGYYGNSQGTNSCMEGDWFQTGDMGHIDKDGFLYVQNHHHNFIMLPNGDSVPPETLEEPFYSYPYIQDCLVQEMKVNGVCCVGIQILPSEELLHTMSDAKLRRLMLATVDDVNSTRPPYCSILHVVVRRKDFERSLSNKILRNKNIYPDE